MTLALRAAGAIVHGTTSAAPAYPVGIVAGDAVFLGAAWKDESATAPTISGWTKIEDQVVGTGTDGAGAGQQRIVLYRKDTVVSDESGTVTVTPSGSANVCSGAIIAFSKTDTTWDIAYDWGTDATAAANLSAPSQAQIPQTANDLIAVLACHTANTNMGSSTVTTTGITYGTAVEHVDGGTVNGNDQRITFVSRPVTSGTQTAVTTFTSTITGTTNGGAIFIRLREAAGGTTPVSTTRATTWDVLAQVSAAKAAAWDTRAEVSASRVASYDVLASVSAAREATWDTLASVTAARATTWDVRAEVAATRAASWDVLASVTASRVASWDTLASVSAARAASWDTLATVTAARSTTWNVLSSLIAVSTTRSTTWNVKAQVGASRVATWDTRAVVEATRATTWRVLAAITAARATTWRVLAALTTDRVASWRTLATASATRSTTWNVSSDVVIVTPAERIYVVDQESRVTTVGAQSRVTAVPAASRTTEVS